MAPRYSFQDIRTRRGGEEKNDAPPPKKVHIRVTKPSDLLEKEEVIDPRMGDPFLSRRGSRPLAAKPVSRAMVRERHNGGWRPRIILWSFALGTVAFLGVSVAAFFGSATVVVVPEQETVSVNADLAASKDTGKVPYAIVVFSKEDTKHISAPINKEVARKASGTITIYNEFSKDSQRLIKNTRFEAPNKKIYRLPETVVVPGFKTVDGQVVPGTLDTVIYADEPGESYNQDQTTFTLPALASSPRFTKVYAKSKTPLSGGFVGTVRTASQDDINKTRDILRKELSDTLLGDAKAAAGEGTVFFPSAAFFVYDDPVVPGNSTSPSIPVTQKVTLHAVLFNRNNLTVALANAAVPGYDGSLLTIKNLTELNVSVVGKDAIKVPGDKLVLRVNGPMNIVWTPPAEALQKALAGTKKTNFQEVLATFPHIKNADALIRPFWQRSFPALPQEIKIKVSEE